MKADYPGKASHSRLKWETLAGFWHPVACTSDVGDERPVGAVLLDVPLVLYRIARQVTAALDRCPHRGTRLSLGRLANGRLICSYHGIAFDAAGHCRTVPSASSSEQAIHYLNTPAFMADERYAPGNQHAL